MVKYLSPDDIYLYLTEHYVPSANDKLVTQTVVKGKEKKSKTLTFQHGWLQRYPWLVYSPSLGGDFCKYCVIFAPGLGSGSLVTKSFNNLKKATGKHGVLQCHNEHAVSQRCHSKGRCFYCNIQESCRKHSLCSLNS